MTTNTMTQDQDLAALRAELERLAAERDAAAAERDAAAAERDAAAAERDAARRVLEQTKAKFDAERAEFERKLAAVQHRLDQLLKRAFGRSSERIDPKQIELFLAEQETREKAEEATPEASPHAGEAPDGETPEVPQEKGKRKKKGHGARKLPGKLPQREQLVEPPAAARVCPCCGEQKVPMGLADVTWRLDSVPASLVAVKLIRPRYRCASTSCPSDSTIAPLPPTPLDTLSGRSRPLAGLLAFVVTSKFADHLPLHRLEAITARSGFELSRSILCEWLDATADLLEGVAEAVRDDVLGFTVVGMDETGVRVVFDKKDPKRGTRRASVWVYRGRPGDVFFEFSATKSASSATGPRKLLEGYRGWVQADADGNFDAIFANGRRVEVGCNAHARRYFVKAKDSSPREAAAVLAHYARVYAIEDEIRGKPPEVRHAARQARSKPILAELDAFVDQLAETVVPGTPLAKAVHYSRRHRVALRRFLDDGVLEIDNNAVERALRQVAVGRKNWLFAGSPQAAKNATIFYTLVGSCKELKIDPWDYLRDVIERVGTHPAARIQELTPRRWLAAREAAKAAAEAAKAAAEAAEVETPRTGC
jgi:transposase